MPPNILAPILRLISKFCLKVAEKGRLDFQQKLKRAFLCCPSFEAAGYTETHWLLLSDTQKY